MKLQQKTMSSQQALTLFQQGMVSQAEAMLTEICRDIRRSDYLAWFLLGSIKTQAGDFSAAKHCFETALKKQANSPECYNNLGVVSESLDDFTAAKAYYEKALNLRPSYANALFNLGYLKEREHLLTDARDLYLKALDANPVYLKARNNLGTVFTRLNDADTAIKHLTIAQQSAPDDVTVLVNLASAYIKANNLNKARLLLEQARTLSPTLADIYCNLALIEQRENARENAVSLCEKALSLNPGHTETLFILANIYREQEAYTEAIALYNDIIKLNSKHINAYNNLGLSLIKTGEFDAALSVFHTAYALDEKSDAIGYNIATSSLGRGDFSVGWDYFRFRPAVKLENLPVRPTTDLSDITGETFYIVGEQGLGDELFYLRFLSSIKNNHNRIVYKTSPKLLSILKREPLIDEVIDTDFTGKYGVNIAVADLPFCLRHSAIGTIPTTIALTPLEQRTNEMKAILAALGPPPYIGVTWRGGQKQENFLSKEIDLTDLAHSLRGIRGTLVILQRNPAPGEIDDFSTALGKPAYDLSKWNSDLEAMLALLSILDDYIAVSNTNVHLRHGVGKNCHVLVCFPPEWRWLNTGHESPWFPGSTVYRQEIAGDWRNALNELTRNFAHYI